MYPHGMGPVTSNPSESGSRTLPHCAWMELVDDPLVLHAALSLVDEWYSMVDAAVGRGNVSTLEFVPVPACPHGLRKRVRDDLTSVAELQQRARKRREPRPERPPQLQEEALDGDTTEESVDDATMVVASPRVAAQARRLLQAVQSYTKVHATMRQALSVIERISLRPVDVQILNDFNRRLDALMAITRTHQLPPSLGIKDYAEDFAFTPNRFRTLVHTRLTFPFKLSVVVDVYWRYMQMMRFGDENQDQLSICTQNDAFGMVSASVHTPSGYLAEHGAVAQRRVDETDGSVVLLHTVITTAPPQLSPHPPNGGEISIRPNVLAGCTVKQAGWTRFRHADNHDGVPSGRPLVVMERVQGIVIEASPRCTVSRDQLELILDVFGEKSSTQRGSREALENLLIDASIASEKRAVVRTVVNAS